MNEPSPQPVRRKVGLAVTSVIAILVLWIVGQNVMGRSSYEREMAQASLAVSSSDWQGAKKHFREAAASKILDKDAIFGLHLMERLEDNVELTRFEIAIRDADLDGARAACEEAPSAELRDVQRSFLDQMALKAE